MALPSVSLAAIDDAGMKYISASEGLGGNVRIRLLSDSDKDNSSPEVAYSSSRLFVVGDADLGGGLAATYYVEIRPSGANGTAVETQSVDVGLRGPFGWFRGGRIESASSAIIPSADRTADVGTSGEKLAGDYDNGLRWTSNDLSGLTLGASVRLVDEAADDPAVDQFDVVASYSLPNGVDLGAGYTNQVEALTVFDEADKADVGGVRVGVRYTQDNWGVAYNFHSYEGYAHDDLTVDRYVADNTVPISVDTSSFDINSAGQLVIEDLADLDNFTYDDDAEPDKFTASPALFAGSDLEFTQHVIGGNVQLGKFGLSFNYALSNYANDTEDWGGATGDQALDLDVTLLAADVSYSLGSKARMILAFKNEETSSFASVMMMGVDDAAYAVLNSTEREVDDKTTYYLLYRVDF